VIDFNVSSGGSAGRYIDFRGTSASPEPVCPRP
jgi:hypothetical protein